MARLLSTAPAYAPPLDVHDARRYGVRGDARRVTNAAMSSGSATLTASGAGFGSGDVGKTIGVFGASATLETLITTIASVQSSTQVTLAAANASGGAISNAYAAWGTNDTAALNAAISAINAAGGGTLKIGGYSILTSSLLPRNYVNVAGAGRYVSGFIPLGGSGICAFRFIGVGEGIGTELTGCTFSDFEIDGRGEHDAIYNVQTKGFFGQYLKRCHWRNLYVHDTAATGIGVDYLIGGCTIIDVICENCGTSGAGLGSAGIGIGTGAYHVEDALVLGCRAVDCALWGIFFEAQGATATFKSRGARVIGNYVQGGCSLAGISDKGMDAMHTADNIIDGVTGHGFWVTHTSGDTGLPINGQFLDNIVTRCGGDGLRVELDAGPYQINGNQIQDNTGDAVGLHPSGGSVSGVQVARNLIHGNGGAITNSGTIANLDTTGNLSW